MFRSVKKACFAKYVEEVLVLLHKEKVNLKGLLRIIPKSGTRIIADDLRVNTVVKELRLDSNQIDDCGIERFADALEINHTIERVSFDDNKIGDVGATLIARALQGSTLKALEISGNFIGNVGASKLADAIQVNRSLKVLSLAKNQIGDEGAAKIADAVRKNGVLEQIDLRDNRIGTPGASHLADMLRTNESLNAVLLSNNPIGAVGGSLIGDALRVNHTLLWVDLENDLISDSGAPKIAEAIAHNQTLIILNLAGNAFTNTTAIADALRQNKTLRCVNLSHNPFPYVGQLGDAAMSNPSLEDFWIQDNQQLVGDGGERKVSSRKISDTLQCKYASAPYRKAFSSCGKLNTFPTAILQSVKKPFLRTNADNDLGSLQMDEEEVLYDGKLLDIFGDRVKRISDDLRVNEIVKKLSLKSNCIVDGEAERLVDSLKENQTLEELSLDDNLIGDLGAKSLANALMENRKISVLGLGKNSIGDAGAEELSEALKVNNTLKWIRLGSNKIHNFGGERLMDAVKLNHTLLRIDMQNNEISDAAALKLADALQVNQTCIIADVGGNEITEVGAKAIINMLKQNTTIRCLNLANNRYEDKLDDMMTDLVRCNHTIEGLWIKSNYQIIGKGGTRRVDAGEIRNLMNQVYDVSFQAAARSEPNENEPKSNSSQFYENLIEMFKGKYDAAMAAEALEELLLLITDMHSMKFFYTGVSSYRRVGLLAKEDASQLVTQGLLRSKEFCKSECEIADFKLILEKGEADGMIQRRDFLILDNLAEQEVIKNSPFIMNIAEAVKSNTARIEGLESNVEAIHKSVNEIKKGLRRKMKVECTLGCICCIINAVSLGVGGNLLSAASSSVLGSIVDFGDITHIEEIASGFEECEKQVCVGKEIGKMMMDGATQRLADKLLEDAVKRNDTLTLVSAAAAAMNPVPSTNIFSSDEKYTADAFLPTMLLQPAEQTLNNSKIDDNDAEIKEEDEEPFHMQNEPMGENDPEMDASDIKSDKEENEIEQLSNATDLREEPFQKQSIMPETGSKMQQNSSYEVERWLLSHLPRLMPDDVEFYSKNLIDEGFDSLDMLNELVEEDLDFMKKGHRRVLSRVLTSLRE